MNPLLMFLLAIVSPLLLALTLLVPPYAGITASAYIIYLKPAGKVHPLTDKLGDVFYMIDVYVKMFAQWTHHITDSSFLWYTLPLLVLPILGFMLSIWLTGKLARKLMDIFQLGVH